MNEVLVFGKHKGKKVTECFKEDPSYISWIMKLENPSNHQMKRIQEYYKDKKFYDINKLRQRQRINVSNLSNYLKEDESVQNIIQKLTICENDVGKIHRSDEIEPCIYGQFIDYLLRYEISLLKKESFKDDRCENSIFLPNTLICYDSEWNVIKREVIDIDEKEEKIKKHGANMMSKGIGSWSSSFHPEIYRYGNPGSISKILESYDKMQKSVANSKDILNVSLSHSIAFGKRDIEKYININEQITPEDRNTLKNYIQNKVSCVSKDDILCNPTLGISDLRICADADLIIGEELFDFKVSNYIGNNVSDFIQLMVYAGLHFKKNNKLCKKLTIYNPLLGKEFYIDINDNIIDKIFEIIKNYKIGDECKEKIKAEVEEKETALDIKIRKMLKHLKNDCSDGYIKNPKTGWTVFENGKLGKKIIYEETEKIKAAEIKKIEF
jgi:hypothetical protein